MRIKLLILFLVISYASYSQDNETIYLWPDKAQAEGSTPTVLPDRGDGVIRITDVSQPALIVFLTPEERNSGAAAIVCPGGAFRHLSLNKEGYEVADWLNSIGISAFVLQYSVPDKHDQAGKDIQRAMRIVRSRADEWGINQKKLGVIGFSAGGNLSARVSVVPEKNVYNPVDLADNVSCIPDFALLMIESQITHHSI